MQSSQFSSEPLSYTSYNAGEWNYKLNMKFNIPLIDDNRGVCVSTNLYFSDPKTGKNLYWKKHCFAIIIDKITKYLEVREEPQGVYTSIGFVNKPSEQLITDEKKNLINLKKERTILEEEIAKDDWIGTD